MLVVVGGTNCIVCLSLPHPPVLTSSQLLLDSHDIMKAIVRLGPRAPAVLPAVDRSRGEEGLSDRTISPNLSTCTHGDGTSPARSREIAKLPVCGTEQCQTTATKAKELREVSFGNKGKPREEEPSSWSGERRGRCDGRNVRADSSAGDGERRSDAQSPWRGFDVREEEMTDASTRKLCSLPFDYFRLIANVARVPSGRAVVQNTGTLKRCLERLALDVSGCSAAQLATLRCRSEICILIGRMAGTYEPKSGAANEFILFPRYQTLRVLLGMLATPPEHGRSFGASVTHIELARHNAAFALAEICRDTFRSVPLVAAAGGIHLACRIANDLASPIPLLKQVRAFESSFPHA